MSKDWDAYVDRAIMDIRNRRNGDAAAAAWSAFLFCRKSIPDTEEGRKLRRNVTNRAMMALWGITADMVAFNNAHDVALEEDAADSHEEVSPESASQAPSTP